MTCKRTKYFADLLILVHKPFVYQDEQICKVLAAALQELVPQLLSQVDFSITLDTVPSQHRQTCLLMLLLCKLALTLRWCAVPLFLFSNSVGMSPRGPFTCLQKLCCGVRICSHDPASFLQ